MNIRSNKPLSSEDYYKLMGLLNGEVKYTYSINDRYIVYLDYSIDVNITNTLYIRSLVIGDNNLVRVTHNHNKSINDKKLVMSNKYLPMSSDTHNRIFSAITKEQFEWAKQLVAKDIYKDMLL